MIPVMVTPDDRLDGSSIDIDIILLQNGCHITVDNNLPLQTYPLVVGGKVFPVFPDT
jgi:hypothetical protein